MPHLPTEVIECIVDFLDDDRSSLLSCSMIGRSWRVRSLAHLFRILQVTQTPYSFDRWWSSSSTTAPVAFIRVTVAEFAKLLRELPQLIRFVVHLQVGDWLDGREHDDAYSTFLRELRLPEGHSVERLSLIGRFRFQCSSEAALHANFGRLKMLQTHVGQYVSLEDFAERLSAMPTLRCLRVSGHDFMPLSAESISPVAPVLCPPQFIAPCSIELEMNTNSAALSAVLRWISMDTARIAGVEIVGSITAYVNQQLTDRPLGDLLQDPASPMLQTIRSLDLSFEDVMLDDFATLVSHLPAIKHVRCTIAFQRFWAGRLSRLFAQELVAPSLREIEIIFEYNFTLPWMLTNPWEAIPLAITNAHWCELRALVIRVRWNQTVPSVIKTPLQQNMDNLFIGTKISMVLEDNQ